MTHEPISGAWHSTCKVVARHAVQAILAVRWQRIRQPLDSFDETAKNANIPLCGNSTDSSNSGSAPQNNALIDRPLCFLASYIVVIL